MLVRSNEKSWACDFFRPAASSSSRAPDLLVVSLLQRFVVAVCVLLRERPNILVLKGVLFYFLVFYFYSPSVICESSVRSRAESMYVQVQQGCCCSATSHLRRRKLSHRIFRLCAALVICQGRLRISCR